MAMTAAALKGPADVVTTFKGAAALTTTLRARTDTTSGQRVGRRRPHKLRKWQLERATHLIPRALQELHTSAKSTL